MNFIKFDMCLMIEFSFMVFRCQTKAQTISEHWVFQKCSRSKTKKSLKLKKKMVPKLKKSLKIGQLCLKFVKFMVFTQKSKKKLASSNLRNFSWNWPSVSRTSPAKRGLLNFLYLFVIVYLTDPVIKMHLAL